MQDYSKLVEALRHVGICQDCNECEAGRWYNEFDCCIFKDAADAIEALQAEEPTENQVVDYCHKRCLVVLSADLFHELKASYGKMPKRGEWICEDLDNFRKYKVTCPHCGAWFVGNYDAYDEPSEFLYCPHCGNICNPTNLDWEREKEARAKMEEPDDKQDHV